MKMGECEEGTCDCDYNHEADVNMRQIVKIENVRRNSRCNVTLASHDGFEFCFFFFAGCDAVVGGSSLSRHWIGL